MSGPYLWNDFGAIEVRVYLPELTSGYKGDEPTDEMVARAWSAVEQVLPKVGHCLLRNGSDRVVVEFAVRLDVDVDDWVINK